MTKRTVQFRPGDSVQIARTRDGGKLFVDFGGIRTKLDLDNGVQVTAELKPDGALSFEVRALA